MNLTAEEALYQAKKFITEKVLSVLSGKADKVSLQATEIPVNLVAQLPAAVTSCTLKAYRSGCVVALHIDITMSEEITSTATIANNALPRYPFGETSSNTYVDIAPYYVSYGSYTGKNLAVGVSPGGNVLLLRGGAARFMGEVVYITTE